MERMNIVQLSRFATNTGECIDYLRNRNLLPKRIFCCRNECKIIKDNMKDGQIFRCTVCHKKKSIRTGSFFSGSSLPLGVLLTIVFYFITGCQISQAIHHLKGLVGKKGIIQWYTYCREICSLYLLTDGNIRLGGHPDSVVQIDETFMHGKLKYERGARKKRAKPIIIFGMIDTLTKQCLVRIVPDRSRETLLPIILRYVTLGSTIYSDEAPAYFSLSQHGYQHKTVKHKDEYVTPEGVHSNCIENLCSHLKGMNKKIFGTRNGIFPLYLDEFVYKFNKRTSNDIFEDFLHDISMYYPV